MTTRAPKDISSYLHLARPERGAGWRLAVGFVAGTVGFFMVTLVALLTVALVVRLTGHHLVVNTNHVTATLLLATNLGLAACIPLAGVLSWALYGLKPRWLGSVAPGIRRRWLAVCVGITAAVWGTLLVFLLLVTVASGQATFSGQVLAFIVVVLLTTPLQAAGEEYLFRGFLLQSLGATGLQAPSLLGRLGCPFRNGPRAVRATTLRGQVADRGRVRLARHFDRRVGGVDRDPFGEECLHVHPGGAARTGLGDD